MHPQELKNVSVLSRFHNRIEECCHDASQGPVIILALGDSVTAGAAENGLYTDDSYHAQLKAMLERRYPRCTFQVVYIAEGGETATVGLERFETVDIPPSYDLLIVAYGLNDASSGGRAGLAQYRLAIETFIARSRARSDANILLLTTNMMPLYATDKIPERWKHLTESFIQIQKTGVLADYADCLKAIAAEQDVAVADVYAAWQELASQGINTTQMLNNGLNHPDERGHLLAAQVIMNVIEQGRGEA